MKNQTKKSGVIVVDFQADFTKFKNGSLAVEETDDAYAEDKVSKVVVYGIATDYCVRATALDAVAAGYQVILIKKLCRGVAPDTTQKALKEMELKGVAILDEIDMGKMMAD